MQTTSRRNSTITQILLLSQADFVFFCFGAGMNFAITIGMLIYTNLNFSFKTPDTVGNCQKPGSPFGLPQHMHKIENL